MPEMSVYWQGREWTSKGWNQYQKDLKRSDIEQAKKDLLERNKKYPPTITIFGKTINPRE